MHDPAASTVLATFTDRLVSSRQRPEGVRLPVTAAALPPCAAAAGARATQVLQSRRAPAQLSLFGPATRTTR